MTLRSLFLSIAFIGLLGISGQAHADVLIWDWSYDSQGGAGPGGVEFIGGGSLTTDSTPNSDGYYLVTGISGSWFDDFYPYPQYTITGLAAPGQGVVDSNDNLLGSNVDGLTENGISFYDSSGELDAIKLYTVESQAEVGNRGTVYYTDNFGIFEARIVSEVSVPEPSQYGSLLVVIAVGLIAWRRFSRATLTV